MKPGRKGIEAIKEAIIAAVPRRKLEDKSWSLEDWVTDQLMSHEWIIFNQEKANDLNTFYQLKDAIIAYFK